MFGLFSRTLKIALANTTVEFRTARDFEFALAGRVGIPASKIGTLVDLADDDRQQGAEGIRKLEQRFAKILAAAMEAGTQVGPVLKVLDPALVSQANAWRTIIDALNQMPAQYEEFKRIALVKYMQYLTTRHEAIRTPYSHRQRNRAEGATQVANAEGGGTLKETVVFSLAEVGTPDIHEQGNFKRLPKGETVELELEPNAEVPILLVKHQCKLIANDDLLLVDDQGHAMKIPPGRNTVGRDVKCDLPMHLEHQDISRKHLIIERFSDHGLRLTDVSSLDTFIAPECIERTSI